MTDKLCNIENCEKPKIFQEEPVSYRLVDVDDWIALLQSPGVHNLLDTDTRLKDSVSKCLLAKGVPEIVLLGIGVGIVLR